jgi:hypothetical protein
LQGLSRVPDCYLFAGPSLTPAAAAHARRSQIVILPPAKRGDVGRLAAERKPATLVLADGRFHDAMSVGHAELRDAIDRGWQVWGVSSLGAIRAYEMRHLGMRGYGNVYRLFYKFADFQDDEVALLHAPRPPYTAASEPLVHMRYALGYLVRCALIQPAQATRILKTLKGLWYGFRTLALFAELAAAGARIGKRQGVGHAIADFDRFRVKQKDLAALLATRPRRQPR